MVAGFESHQQLSASRSFQEPEEFFIRRIGSCINGECDFQIPPQDLFTNLHCIGFDQCKGIVLEKEFAPANDLRTLPDIVLDFVYDVSR